MSDPLPAVIDEAMPVEMRQPDRPPLALVKTATEMRVVEVSDALAPAYAKASTLDLSDAEVSALMAPFPDSSVDIRPHDGLIFISHIHISDRLNAVFKPGKWAMICRKHWLEGGTLYGEYVLLIRGCFVGESVGGHQYQPNNPKTNYSDSLESTAAEALRRIAGKRLSCGSQVWHKDYAEKWVGAHAEQINGKWRKKALGPSKTPTNPPARKPEPAPVEKLDNRFYRQAEAATPLTPEERKATLLAKLKGFEPEATTIFREEGLVLPTEDFTEISTFTVERIQPAHMLALVKQVKARREEQNQIPDAEVTDADVADPVGTVEETNEKTGTTKAGKPWVKFGVKIDSQWLNTFSATDYETATALKGRQVRYTFAETKFGKDLLTIESAEENQP